MKMYRVIYASGLDVLVQADRFENVDGTYWFWIGALCVGCTAAALGVFEVEACKSVAQ